MIKSLDDKSFKADIINYEQGPNAPYEIKRNSVIMFYIATCPHCIAMEPIFHAASEEFPDIDFYKVEAKEHPKLAALYNIDGTPTFIMIPMKGSPKMAKGQMPLADFAHLLKATFK